jgi:mono/diheme cytochrome c family protein
MALLARVLGIIVVSIVIVAATVYLIGSLKLNRKFDIAPQPLALSVPSDAASVARGRHLAVAITKCTVCHSADLGGTIFIEAPPFRLVAPNLTKGAGGVGGSLSDADYVRAIRHGVAPDGRGLLVMPSREYASLSDADLAAVIAYAKSVAPVNRTLPPTDIRPLGRMLLAVGLLPESDANAIDHNAQPPATMPAAVTLEYGRYMAQIGGCTGCHRANLAGGHVPGTPPDYPDAQNITPAAIGSWSEADFFHALRAGKRPDGTTINPFMPWAATAQMTDGEIKALWMYVRSVPPVSTTAK